MKGVKISTANSQIKYKNRDDLLLIVFEKAASVAGIFTSSSMPAAPVTWCKKNIGRGIARALIVNAGNANAFTGKAGEEAVLKTADAVAVNLGCKAEEVLVCSTGVIGETLPVHLITAAITHLVQNLEDKEELWNKAAKAIMTTDTKVKLIKKTCEISGVKINIFGFAKGSGMIAPNMATLLGYIFTDADITAGSLQTLLAEVAAESFNAISVDSDQSTNDTILLFATGTAGNRTISDCSSAETAPFKVALQEVSLELAKMVVTDGEGAKKLIEIEVSGATTRQEAKTVAFAIANSPLVKTAIAGCDPNWGRIIMAVGKSCKETSPKKITVKIGDHLLTKEGAGNPGYVEKMVHEYLKNSQVKISVDLGIGIDTATVWTCDLNEEYVTINKNYRS
jgi:glutamate N-acetyltransferase/amino-acid N-acetyltransferase